MKHASILLEETEFGAMAKLENGSISDFAVLLGMTMKKSKEFRQIVEIATKFANDESGSPRSICQNKYGNDKEHSHRHSSSGSQSHSRGGIVEFLSRLSDLAAKSNNMKIDLILGEGKKMWVKSLISNSPFAGVISVNEFLHTEGGQLVLPNDSYKEHDLLVVADGTIDFVNDLAKQTNPKSILAKTSNGNVEVPFMKIIVLCTDNQSYYEQYKNTEGQFRAVY